MAVADDDPDAKAAVAAGVSTVGGGVADSASRHPHDAEGDERRRHASVASHQTNRWVWSRIMPPMCRIGSQKRPVEPPSSSDESV